MKQLTTQELQQVFDWIHYSTHHPSWDMVQVLRDFHNKVPLDQAKALPLTEPSEWFKFRKKDSK